MNNKYAPILLASAAALRGAQAETMRWQRLFEQEKARLKSVVAQLSFVVTRQDQEIVHLHQYVGVLLKKGLEREAVLVGGLSDEAIADSETGMVGVFEYFARIGEVGLLKVAYRPIDDEENRTSRAAARGGHLDVLQWMYAQGYLQLTEELCEDACGQLAILRWLRSLDPPCPWGYDMWGSAIYGGRPDVLQWLLTHGQPALGTEYESKSVSQAAARAGHLNVLELLRARDLLRYWDVQTCEAAAADGRLNVLEWLRAQDPPCPWDTKTCAVAAARGGHLSVLQWLAVYDPPCLWDVRTSHLAAYHGHLNVVQWLRAQDPPCSWDEKTCVYAVEVWQT